MPKYTPPPPTLDHLNPIQRYLQKGELERQDWIRLIALIVIYFVARPYIQKAAKWWFGDEKMEAGERAQKEHREKRARAKVGVNTIRSGKKDDDSTLDNPTDKLDAVTSGRTLEGDQSAVQNRKVKSQPTGKKSVEDELLDWDDEPAREHVEGEKTDVMQWLDKWDE